MIMKALSIRQPWASLIADGHKKFETRSWSTEYRGPLLICAAKQPVRWQEADKPIFEAGIHPSYYLNMPFGVALCVVDFVRIYTTTPVILASWPDNWDENMTKKERQLQQSLGNFCPGQFAWDLRDVRKLAHPFPVKGRPGLFDVDVPDDVKFEE